MRDGLCFLDFGNILQRTEFLFFIRLNKKSSRTSSVVHFCLLGLLQILILFKISLKGTELRNSSLFLRRGSSIKNLLFSELTVKLFGTLAALHCVNDVLI